MKQAVTSTTANLETAEFHMQRGQEAGKMEEEGFICMSVKSGKLHGAKVWPQQTILKHARIIFMEKMSRDEFLGAYTVPSFNKYSVSSPEESRLT